MYKFNYLSGDRLQSYRERFRTVEPMIISEPGLRAIPIDEFTGLENVKQRAGWHADSPRGGGRRMFLRDCEDDHLCNILMHCPHIGQYYYMVIASILEERGFSRGEIRKYDGRGDLKFWNG